MPRQIEPPTPEELRDLEEFISIVDREALLITITKEWILRGEPFEQFAMASLFFKCERCGRCCDTFDDIALSPKELSRIAKYLDISDDEFKTKYTRTLKLPVEGLEELGYVSISVPCPFHKHSNCAIYDVRPNACVMFPCFMSLQGVDLATHSMTVDPTCIALKKAMDFVNSHEKEAYKEQGKFLDKNID